MRLTLVTGACCVVETPGLRLLCDPWLSDGAFLGSWYHDPPVTTTPDDLLDVDAIFLSHRRADRYDPATLAHFPRSMPVIMLTHGNDAFRRTLEREGFTSVRTLVPDLPHVLGDAELTVHPAPPTPGGTSGRFGGSALVVDDGRHVVLHANHDGLTPEAAAALRVRHGRCDVALLRCGTVGAFPASSSSHTTGERREVAAQMRTRELDRLVEVARALGPGRLVPVGSAFVLAGTQAAKQPMVATVPAADVAARFGEALSGVRVTVPSDGLTIDLDPTRDPALDHVDGPAPAAHRVEQAPPVYPHERADLDELLITSLRRDLPAARAHMWEEQRRADEFADLHVYFDVGDDRFHFHMGYDAVHWVDDWAPLRRPFLRAHLDPRLLREILDRRARSEDAETGHHLDVWHDPSTPFPDLHTMFSSFHLAPTPTRRRSRSQTDDRDAETARLEVRHA